MKLVLALCALAAAAPAFAAPTVEEVFARTTTTVAPGVWLIAKSPVTEPPFEGNSVVVEQEKGLVVIDAGGSPASGRAIVAEIRKISPKPVTWLVYTHYHGDHNLGAGALKAAWPRLKIVSTARTRENMTGSPMAYVETYSKSYGDMAATAAERANDNALPNALRQAWRRIAEAGPAMVEAYSGMRPTPADQVFTDRFELPDARAPVELRYLGRANTDGDLVAWAPRQKVLAAGDIVVAPVPYAAHTFPTDWIAALSRVEAYPFAVLVPGHGRPQTDRAYADKLIATLTELRAQVAPLARAGIPLDEVRKRVDLEPTRARFAGEDPWLRYLIGAVFTGDLISNLYKEARGEPVIQGKG
jgi:glyoxylase-like metal-dependent hydrolase (beta-lactamase superfamily II)